MRRAVAVAAAAAALALPSPAFADLGNGPATVTLTECAQGVGQSDELVPDCSYLHFPGRSAPSYIYFTSQGPVTWLNGSLSSNVLSFPATDQTWPTLTGLYRDYSLTWTPKDIAGTVDADGNVRMAMLYQFDVDIPTGAAAGTCTLSGIVELSSAAGRTWDPSTGAFAVASTNAYPPIPSLNATCLRLGTIDYDLLQGASWYLAGTMDLPTAATPVSKPQRAQKAKLDLPKRITPKGRTVLLAKAVRTNAGKKLKPTVTWSPSKPRFASVKVTKAGKVSITTTGKAKRLRVTLALTASGTPEFLPYSSTRTWLVRRG